MIRLVITDCDGVLTTDSKWYTQDGKIIKRFSTKDTTVIQMMERLHGVPTYVLSGDDRVNRKFCQMHRIPFVKAVHNKAEAVNVISERTGISTNQILFVGDDLPDIKAGQKCEWFLCPVDAAPDVRWAASHVLSTCGGRGVFTEFYPLYRDRMPTGGDSAILRP